MFVLLNLYSVNLKEVLEVINSYLVIILKDFQYKGVKVVTVKSLQVVIYYVMASIFHNLILYKFTDFSFVDILRLYVKPFALSPLSFSNLCPNI